MKNSLLTFWESWTRKENEEILRSENTRLGKVLKLLNRKYNVIDLSNANYKHWELRKEVLLKLKKRFLLEGNEKLFNSMFSETARLEHSIGSRYLYIVNKSSN